LGLPSAWWDDFYTPMEQRIEALRTGYGKDAEALANLNQLAQEPELHRPHGSYYACEFFVASPISQPLRADSPSLKRRRSDYRRSCATS
jgi:hypothetical protein